VYVDFDYFDHGASGDFFAVNSYIGQIDYEDIPAIIDRKMVKGFILEMY
jgi:hypothetical protein